MASKNFGYVLGGLEILAGAVLTFAIPGGAAIGVPLMISGAATVAGTALMPQPPRQKTLRSSPNYGIDQFENPRGRDAFLPVPYGVVRVRLPVIQESVSSVAENSTPGVDAQKKQGFKWLGGCEGPVEEFTDVEVNDRRVFNDPVVDREIGKGTGTKKVFEFPDKWIWLGPDEAPAVEVKVDGVVKSLSRKSRTDAPITVPAPPAAQSGPGGIPLPVPLYTIDVKVDRTKGERILEATLKVFISGTGHPRAEQPRRSGTYKWSAQKRNAWTVRVKFLTRPPTGFKVEMAFDYLGSDGCAVTRDFKGRSKVTFGTAPANNKKVTASWKTTNIPELRIDTRLGTPDQSPIQGFTDLEQSNNVASSQLVKDQPTPNPAYRTKLAEVDDLRIVLLAPRGFIQYKDDGGTAPVSAKVRIEYRKVGDSTWTVLRSPSGTEFYLSAQRSQAVRWEIGIRKAWQDLIDTGDADAADKLDAFDRGSYEVRVTRTTAETVDALVAHELHFQTVTEILFEGFTYPGTALLAISGLPTEYASGGSLRVTALVRRGKIYDPRTDPHYGRRDLGSSQNPALALRDLITSGEGAFKERYGGGYFFTAADFLLGEDGRTTGEAPNAQPLTDGNGFIAFADFCDEWVHRPGDVATKPPYSGTFGSVAPYSSDNGERRCRLNVVLDTPQSLMETVSDLAFLGYCFASLQGARWRFPLDQDGDPVYAFVDDVDPPNANCDSFEMTLEPWGKTPTHVAGQFWNEALNFDRDELLLPVEGLVEGQPVNVKETALVGCTRETEAGRMLRHLAEQAALHPYPCTWRAHPGVMFLEAGDIVTVKTRVPYATGTQALELRVRVLSARVARGEDGRMEVRYGGRVMASKGFALKPVTMPVSKAAVAQKLKDAAEPVVSGLSAKVV